jgi:hypothetical protein
MLIIRKVQPNSIQKMNSNKDRHRLRRRGTRFGEDCVKTEFRRTQRDIILLAIEPLSGSPRTEFTSSPKATQALIFCFFCIKTKEDKETSSYFAEFLPVSV